MSCTIASHPNTIPEVVIGTQTWAAQNYDFGGTYPDGIENYVTDYGRLYTWAEAMAIDVAGWHLPTSVEVGILIAYLGGSMTAGGHLKEIGTTYWTTPNTGADNTSGFSARGSGYNESNFGIYSYFWTSSEFGTDAYAMMVNCTTATAFTFWISKTNRYSVRLLKD